MEDIGSNPMPDITSDGPEGQRIEVITVDVDFDRFFNGAPAPLPPTPPPQEDDALFDVVMADDEQQAIINAVENNPDGNGDDVQRVPVAAIPPIPSPNQVVSVLIYGHSFIRRLNDYLVRRSGSFHNLGLDYGLALTQWFGLGGLSFDKALFQQMAVINLASPSILYVELGSNDLCFTFMSAQQVFQYVQHFVNTLNNIGVPQVILGQVIERRGVGIPLATPTYNRKVIDFNNLVRAAYSNPNGRAFYWRHRGLWNPRRNVLCRDGIHLNRRGQERLYRSIRGAIIFGLTNLGVNMAGFN